MTTVQILGILTLAEMVLCHSHYEGNILVLWVLYGIYKVLMS